MRFAVYSVQKRNVDPQATSGRQTRVIQSGCVSCVFSGVPAPSADKKLSVQATILDVFCSVFSANKKLLIRATTGRQTRVIQSGLLCIQWCTNSPSTQEVVGPGYKFKKDRCCTLWMCFVVYSVQTRSC